LGGTLEVRALLIPRVMSLAERRAMPVDPLDLLAMDESSITCSLCSDKKEAPPGGECVEENHEAMEESQEEEAVAVEEVETVKDKSPDKSHRPSLREQPSFLNEVSIAKSRRAALQDLQHRLSSSRDLLTKAREDLSTKPWLRSSEIPALLRSASVSSDSTREGEDRSRNLSSDTNITENSEDMDIQDIQE